MLPVNYIGLALILLGVGFIVAEAFMPSFGVLGIGGAIALVVGSVMLFDSPVPGMGLPLGLILSVTAITVGLLSWVLYYGAFASTADCERC